jgi:hypothetical protein
MEIHMAKKEENSPYGNPYGEKRGKLAIQKSIWRKKRKTRHMEIYMAKKEENSPYGNKQQQFIP